MDSVKPILLWEFHEIMPNDLDELNRYYLPMSGEPLGRYEFVEFFGPTKELHYVKRAVPGGKVTGITYQPSEQGMVAFVTIPIIPFDPQHPHFKLGERGYPLLLTTEASVADYWQDKLSKDNPQIGGI